MQLKVELLTIPPKTTSRVQPLDVYGFRPWKRYFRMCSKRVLIDMIDFELFHRENCIMLQSLVFRQFTSHRDTNLWKYSFYKSGCSDEKPDVFPDPVEFAFPKNALYRDRCEPRKRQFVRCSWCKDNLCFDCFVTNYHN
ncbi:hypothetical protein RvY_04471 [Ramazzottius varieornatus]|uniref:Transposase Tc5 C-terminal domain-containing protein n=1 Tax=Ramazzottius varieornatus TaxID=947166 RepID=A0A1D1URR1_RAMVA|nr:hypothetical protein RvY_04471 [Ramazzottius varieornatus]